jgi:PIN domain nuclease of toxin-antitoxin system
MDRNKKKNFTVSIASQFEKNVALERRRLNEQFAARKAALASVASSS